MPYNKTVWIDGKSPYINASNLNKQENGIYQNSLGVENNALQIAENNTEIKNNKTEAENAIAENRIDIDTNTDNIAINAENILGLSVGEVYQGTFTPTNGNEYPPAPQAGYSWYITGLTDTGYTYLTGDLSGRVANNNDKTLYNGTEWSMIDNTNCKADLYFVDTIAQMQALSPIDGAICNVRGYYSINDNGGGIFNFDSSQVGTDNTGTIIDGWVRETNGGEVSVAWFGAGTVEYADDTVAIQNAIDAFRGVVYRAEGAGVGDTFNQSISFKLIFPPASYLITSPLDLTDISVSHSMWHVEAEGAVVFMRCTGKTGFDLTGSRRCVWHGGSLIGEQNFLMRTGIQIGRGLDLSSADTLHFQDVEVKGYFSLASLYNFASEDTYFENVSLKNNYDSQGAYCLVQDGDHYFGIESDFVTPAPLNSPASFLRNTFVRFEARKTQSGNTVWMGLTKSHDYISSYLVSEEDSAVVLFANTSDISNTDLKMSIHVETDLADTDPNTGIQNVITFDAISPATEIKLYGFKFNDSAPHCGLSFFNKTGNVETVVMYDADLYLGIVSRDVGQTLFDAPSQYSISGNLVSHNQFDIAGMARFAGRFFTDDPTLKGKGLDFGTYTVQSLGNTYHKNGINLMGATNDISSIHVYDNAEDEKGKLIYNASSDIWSFYNNNAEKLILALTALYAGDDASTNLGLSSRRWKNVYASNGTINTSDARLKTDVSDLNERERKVATALKKSIKKFRFKDAVEAKGSNARLHVGVIAQEVEAIFNEHGLDANQYGMFCYDEWDAEDGIDAGNRYSIRYDELLAFIISAM